MVQAKTVSANFTRPDDTTQYAAGDAVADSTSAPTYMTFVGAGARNAGGGEILTALLVDSANQGTKGEFELWLFNTAPTPNNDNAAFAPTDAMLRTLVGVIEFDDRVFVGKTDSGADGNCVYKPDSIEAFVFNCLLDSQNLYGLLVARNNYTPVAQERFDVLLQIRQY